MRKNATIYGKRYDLRRGYLLVPQEVTGPAGKVYEVDLEYQVFDAETGAPVEDTKRVEGEIHDGRLVIGDPHRDTRLFEYTIASQPTRESHDQWQGYRAGMSDKRWHEEGKSKKYYGQTQAWWEGYHQAHRDKKDSSRGYMPNSGIGLRRALDRLAPALASAAQRVYDTWDQDEDGMDEDLGGGGICDLVAQEMAAVLSSAGIETMEGGHQGDDHAYLIAYNDDEAFAVDIPPGVYETGGGYSWRKRPGVTIDASDVVIDEVRRSDIEPEVDW